MVSVSSVMVVAILIMTSNWLNDPPHWSQGYFCRSSDFKWRSSAIFRVQNIQVPSGIDCHIIDAVLNLRPPLPHCWLVLYKHTLGQHYSGFVWLSVNKQSRHYCGLLCVSNEPMHLMEANKSYIYGPFRNDVSESLWFLKVPFASVQTWGSSQVLGLEHFRIKTQSHRAPLLGGLLWVNLPRFVTEPRTWNTPL